MTKLALYGLVVACKHQDEIIKKLVKNYQIPHYVAHRLNGQWCSIMENLFGMWLTSDGLALHAAFEVQGLEFLLNKIGVGREDALLSNDLEDP